MGLSLQVAQLRIQVKELKAQNATLEAQNEEAINAFASFTQAVATELAKLSRNCQDQTAVESIHRLTGVRLEFPRFTEDSFHSHDIESRAIELAEQIVHVASSGCPIGLEEWQIIRSRICADTHPHIAEIRERFKFLLGQKGLKFGDWVKKGGSTQPQPTPQVGGVRVSDGKTLYDAAYDAATEAEEDSQEEEIEIPTLPQIPQPQPQADADVDVASAVDAAVGWATARIGGSENAIQETATERMIEELQRFVNIFPISAKAENCINFLAEAGERLLAISPARAQTYITLIRQYLISFLPPSVASKIPAPSQL